MDLIGFGYAALVTFGSILGYKRRGSREKMPRWGVWLAPQGRGRAHLQQREVGQKAGVQLFHIVEQFNQVDVSLAQLVAHQVVLSVAFQHLANGGVRSGAQVLAGWTLLLPASHPAPRPPLPLTGLPLAARLQKFLHGREIADSGF
ncbi:TMEM14A [Cervus elaphus hippelaphus]|uniref:TMEM14A n=1 Tax=Cervus elaphus hippelaphus TaxID=46360 RepID=A0A212D573_CEREH|nr:TMEM14A [Cervus elaphus hippelaphus]